MAYKTIENKFSFADIAIQSIADKNRSLLFLREINKMIKFDKKLKPGLTLLEKIGAGVQRSHMI